MNKQTTSKVMSDLAKKRWAKATVQERKKVGKQLAEARANKKSSLPPR